ncbi:MAG: DUF2948 family protein [Caulobacterales bacterium]
MAKPEPLRLLAEDEEDLAVISAAVQDAVARIGDIEWEPKGRRLTIALNRFRWEAGPAWLGERVRAGLQFGSVLAVRARNLRREPKDAVVELLAVSFEPGEPPGGVVRLAFAGDGDLALTVECVDAALADVSTPWPTPRTPAHEA